MILDLSLFRRILLVDSTSGKERELAELLCTLLPTPKSQLQCFEVGDGTLNLLLSWGQPRIYFCTHMDTVPPYIPPKFDSKIVWGRGTCDAKGQIIAMYTACLELERKGYSDFGLLLLAGEETGSHGARAYDAHCPGGEVLIVGEPTDCLQASAAKGTRAYSITIRGRAAHSGYPEQGSSAVDRFVQIMQFLKDFPFAEDSLLGKTTCNVGFLQSDNPANVLSPLLRFRLYFRTTFASHSQVLQQMNKLAKDPYLEVQDLGGDAPMHYHCFCGIPSKPVAFGSDAPRLSKFKHRVLCGPGSILAAHTDNEHVLISDLEQAVTQYVTMYEQYMGKKE